MGLVFVAQAYRSRADLPKRNRCLLAAPAFGVFGLSDIIEIHTGAWWRPWWLLAMKAACIVVFLALLAAHYLRTRKSAHRD